MHYVLYATLCGFKTFSYYYKHTINNYVIELIAFRAILTCLYIHFTHRAFRR